MNDEAALARAAGLDKAWAEHEADVREAIASVVKLRAGFPRPRDAAEEPKPGYGVNR